MAIRLKQSTASQEIPLGVFVDETDGKTAETGLTIANTDIKLWKMGATSLANKNSGGATHISGGIYYAVLDDTDTNTLGGLVIFVHVAGALPVRVECEVLPANVYDSLIAGSDKLQVHADEITNGLITAAAIADNAIDAGAIASDAITAAKIADNAITANKIASDAITAAKIATNAIDADAIAADAVSEIQSGLSTLTQAGVRTAIGMASANLDTQLGSLDTQLGNIGTDVTSVGTVLNEVAEGLFLVKSAGVGGTGNDTTHVHLAGLPYGDDELNNHLIVILDDSANEYHARWITDWVLSTELATVATLPFTPTNSDFYWIVSVRQDVTGGSGLDAAGVRAAIGMASANLDTQLAAIDDYIDTEVAAIKAKTDNLPSDPADASDIAAAFVTVNSKLDAIDDFIDTEVAAIKAKTDNLPSDPADQSALEAILGTPAGASLAADLADIEGKVDDLESRLGTPSNLGSGATIAANLADIEAQTDDIGVAGAGLTDLGGMSTAMKAQVQQEVNDELLAQNLDHLVKSAVDTDFATTVHLNSVIGHLADNGTAASFDRTTDSLEALQAEHDATQAAVNTVDDFLDTEIAAIKAKTDNLPSDPADASDIAASFVTVNSKLDAIDDFIDTEVAAIKAKTDNLPSDPADASDIAASFVTVNSKLDTIDDFLDTEIAAIKAKTDNLPSDPADDSDIDTQLATISSKIDTVDDFLDTEIAAIKAKTDQLAFGVANTVNANITHVIADPVQENGASDTNWGGAT